MKYAKWNTMQDNIGAKIILLQYQMWGKNNIATIPNVISHRGHQ
jgi:hypothetical protein